MILEALDHEIESHVINGAELAKISQSPKISMPLLPIMEISNQSVEAVCTKLPMQFRRRGPVPVGKH